jgi:hypothetical protein
MAMVLPPLLATVIAGHGWRAGYTMLAGFALLPWPFVLWSLGGKAARGSAAVEPWGVDRGVALRSRVFWTIALGFCAIAVAVSALTVHMVPLLHDAGMDPMQAAGVASLTGVGVLLGRLGIGWLMDRFFAPRLAAAIFSLTAIGCLLLVYGGLGLAPVAAFLIGFSLGAEVDLISYLTARYFGIRRYGFLYATIYAWFVVGAAIGPYAAGRIYDATGNLTRPTTRRAAAGSPPPMAMPTSRSRTCPSACSAPAGAARRRRHRRQHPRSEARRNRPACSRASARRRPRPRGGDTLNALMALGAGPRRALRHACRPARRRQCRAGQGVEPCTATRGRLLHAASAGRDRRLHGFLCRHPSRDQCRAAVPAGQSAAAELQIRADRLSRPRLVGPRIGRLRAPAERPAQAGRPRPCRASARRATWTTSWSWASGSAPATSWAPDPDRRGGEHHRRLSAC